MYASGPYPASARENPAPSPVPAQEGRLGSRTVCCLGCLNPSCMAARVMGIFGSGCAIVVGVILSYQGYSDYTSVPFLVGGVVGVFCFCLIPDPRSAQQPVVVRQPLVSVEVDPNIGIRRPAAVA